MSDISKYLAEIGAKGGRAGKGSPAKAASASNAAKVRWAKEKAKKQNPKVRRAAGAGRGVEKNRRTK